MMVLLIGIAAAVAAGALVAYVVAMTFKWLRNKIKSIMTKKPGGKVVVIGFEKLLEQLDAGSSRIRLSDLEKEGYSHVLVSVDANNQVVGEVEIIKDTNEELDAEVDRLLGKERMVVVEG